MADMYIRVSTRAPIPGRVGVGKCNVGVIGYDAANDAKFLSASGTRFDPTSWQGYKISKHEDFLGLYNPSPDNTALVKWMSTYFSELDYQADPASVLFYRYGGEGAGTYTLQVSLPAGGAKEWRTMYSPVNVISEVSVHYAVGYTELNETVVQDVAGYVLQTDGSGKYTGKITFAAGYPRNSGNVEQNVNLSTDSVLISYTTVALAEALKLFNNQDVQLMALAYDPGKRSGSLVSQGIYGGTSFIDDMKIVLTHCNSRTVSGRARQLCCGLPANQRMTDPTTFYGGPGSEYWGGFRANELGQARNVMVMGEQHTLLTSGYYGERDTSAMIAVAVRKSRVRDTLTGFTPTTSVTALENESEMEAYKTAQIMTWVKISHLRAEPFINFGFTFGFGRDARENHVRCINQIKHALSTALLQLVLSPDLKYDLNGMRRIKSVISAVIRECEMSNWCDGIVSTEIPIEEYLAIPVAKRSPEEQIIVTNAQASAIVDNIEVTILWGPNPETIVISALGDI
jgi:hypothetical protein